MRSEFDQELKRRNIFKAIISCLVVSWVVLQVASIVLPILETPTWVLRAVLYLLVLGLPAWLFFAWVYDISPDGIKRTESTEEEDTETSKWTNKQLNQVTIGGLLMVAVLLLTDRLIGDSDSKPVAFQSIQEVRLPYFMLKWAMKKMPCHNCNNLIMATGQIRFFMK